MPFTQKSATLKNLRVNLANGLALNALSIRLTRNLIYTKKKPGQALVGSNVYMGEDDPTIELEVYFDHVANLKNILPNEAVDSFDIISPLDANESIFAAEFFAKFPPSGMVFGSPDTTINGDDLSTIRFPLICNVVNPGPDGGYPTAAPEEDETP